MSAVDIKASCPLCGDQILPPSALHLTTFSREPTRDYYEFLCPRCRQVVRKSANREIVSSLRANRVKETRILIPEEFYDKKRAQTEPLTNDDLLTFWLALQTTDLLSGPCCRCVSCISRSLPH